MDLDDEELKATTKLNEVDKEIEAGEYVRTEKQGIKKIEIIFKNKTVNKYGTDKDSDDYYSIVKTTDIVKHSSNIIDLIEVGDYVNGYLVKSRDIENELRYIDYNTRNSKYVKCLKIQTILTKEQFNQNCYRLEE